MRSISNQFFRRSFWVFPVVLVTGWVIIFGTKPFMGDYGYSNGKELLAMYIPLPLCIFYVVCASCFNTINQIKKWLTALLFILLVVPFYDVLLHSFQHLPQDDGYRYHVVAANIATNKTLWGSDDLVFNTNRRVYLFQPGYRYYLAAWLAIAGKENRLFQFFNMGIYLLATWCLLVRVQKINGTELFKKGFLLFILLSSFYVTKNILMGLSEWLVVSMLFFFVCAWLSKKTYLAIVLLALLPFMRQNLLIAAVLLFIWLTWQRRQRVLYSGIFLAILLLPLYHNLYYAGQWKFLSTYYNTQGYLLLDFGGSVIKTFFYHILLYTGVDWLLHNLLANILAVVCIPLGTALYIYCVKQLKGNEKWIYLAITLAAIGPTLIFGGRAYYPRFEWVNLQFALLFFWLLLYKSQCDNFLTKESKLG